MEEEGTQKNVLEMWLRLDQTKNKSNPLQIYKEEEFIKRGYRREKDRMQRRDKEIIDRNAQVVRGNSRWIIDDTT